MIDHHLGIFHPQSFYRNTAEIKFLSVANNFYRWQGQNDIPDRERILFVQAVERIAGYEEREGYVLWFRLVQQGLRIQFQEVKFQDFLNPGEPLLADQFFKKKKMCGHGVALSKAFPELN